MTTMLGYDVNGAKGTVDPYAAARSGRVFGMPKATEGATFVDSLFAQNRAAMLHAHDGRVCPYHFCRADAGRGYAQGDPRAAIVELDHFLNVLGGKIGARELPMVDFEEPKGYRDDSILPPYLPLGGWLFALVDGVRHAFGRAPIIYTYGDFWHRHVGNDARFAAFPLNLAAYQSTQPAPLAPWANLTFWQHTSSASIPGISGRADEDAFYGDDIRWDALCGVPLPPEVEPMRDERVITIPAADTNGHQVVGVDSENKLLAKWSATRSVTVCAQDDGSLSAVTVEPCHYLDLLLLSCSWQGGHAAEGNVRILIERDS